MDQMYNDAVDLGSEGEVPDGTPIGIANLAFALRVFNSMMSGGLGFTLEVNEATDIQRAVDGFRYFDLHEIAEILAELAGSYGGESFDEMKESRLDQLLSKKNVILDAFRRKVVKDPLAFEPYGSRS
jgi:hypothetical protein